MRVFSVSMFRDNSAISGVARIGSGAAVAQGVALACVPILARLYSPSEMGVFAAVMAIATIFSVVAPLRFDSAIQVAAPRAVSSMVIVASICSIAVSFLCVLVVDSHFANLPGGPSIGVWSLALVCAFTLTTGLFAVLSSVLLRERDYGLIGGRNVVRQIATSSSQIGVTSVSTGWTGLLFGATIGQAVALLLMARRALAIVRRGGVTQFRPRQLGNYWRFPLVLAPSALLNAVGVQVPLLFISTQFGSVDAGNLSQALRIGAAPAIVVGVAVSSVMLSEVSRGVRGGATDQRKPFLRASTLLGCVGACWLGILLVVLPPTLPFLLGPGWDSAADYTRAIALSAAASLVVAPLSSVLIAYQRAWTVLVLDAARIVLTVGSGAVGVYLGMSAPLTCLLMSVGSALAYAATWTLSLRTVSPRRDTAANSRNDV